MEISDNQHDKFARRVLVVEDDVGLLKLTLRVLRKNGFDAEGTGSGAEAVEAFYSDPHRILLTDQQLPDMKGSQVVDILKSKGVDVPFVMMTGQGSEKLAVDMMKLGALDYLIKDVDFTDILPSVLSRVFKTIETEQKLREAQQKLKEREQQLIKSELNLRELNNTKDKFFSIIGHDLKNIFSNIIGFTELMVHRTDIKDYRKVDEYGMRLYDSAKVGYSLLENLLQWARVQTGRLQFNPSVSSFYPIVRDVTDLYELNLRKKMQKVSVECPTDLLACIDPFMIETVIRNLLGNAIKFSPEGGEIIIKTVKENNEVVLSVSDRGVGIRKEDISKLFRLDVNHTTLGTGQEEGSGLGLILCKEFVEKHGGRIWVESQLNVGTTFYFSIPIER